jgi:diguanylate cyclase (GGDEF)-like protein
MAILGTINYQAQSTNGIELLRTKGESLGKFMAAVSAEPLLAYDYVTLNDYVNDISEEKDIVYILITTPEGQNLTSYINEENAFIRDVQHYAKKDVAVGIIDRLSRNPRILNVDTDIFFNGKKLGRVQVGLDRQQAEVLARNSLIQQFISNIILLLILVAAIYIVFRFNTLTPIRLLMKGARRIANGDLDERVLIKSADEMGKLATAFNMMMYSLKSSIQEKDQAYLQLKDLNKSLEHRVDERTRALEEVNRELKHLALHDPLTGLPNRVLVQDRLEQSILEARRNHSSFAVFMIDLDRFKEVNDTLGHDAGDQLLLQVSHRLVEVLRDVDTVGRLGGDEFAIIVNDVNVDSSIIVASKILQAFDRPFSLERMSLSTSASIGVAIFPEHGESTQTLLKSADVAMYVAKQRKEDFCIYHPSKDFHSEQRLSLVGELREAISCDQLTLYYQPKIDLRKQRVVGVEALVRWQHPQKGMISPDEFIPLAEQTGLIKTLTQWVLEQALSDHQGWRAKGLELSVAVNLSTQNLQDTQFVAFLRDALKRHDIPSGGLVLEVTETALMHNTEAAIDVLENLRKLGVLLSIDDFGVGYSSFSYLKRLPVDDIKIDKSFVMDIGRDQDDALIVESIISLAHHLGLQVVAEGVENNTIMKQLVEWNCDLAQGYYISRPVPANELMQFLDTLAGSMNFPVSPAKVVAGQA